MPDPENLMKIFDNISYAKGSVVCRMLANYIGDPALFKECLMNYMQAFKFKCARSEDLLSIMDKLTAGRLNHFHE